VPSEADRTIQTVTLVLADGTRLTYSGKAQVEPGKDYPVVEIVFSRPRPLPAGMTWERLSHAE
jgi:hypothetical protein